MRRLLGAEVLLGLPAAVGASIALVAVFVPGFLLLLAVMPVWAGLTRHAWAASVMAGINAAFGRLLLAAFCDPVLTQGGRTPTDFAIALVGLVLLAVSRVSAMWVVLWCVVASMLISLIG